MAGELGFEPRSSVLETDSLTVELTPLWEANPKARFAAARLLRLFVRRVLAARIAELLELQTACRSLLVLGRRIVPVLAVRALEGNDFAHCLVLLS
jgi:hypothetical protein